MVVIKWFLLSLFIILNTYAQFDWFAPDRQSKVKYYLWNAVTGTNLVTDTDVFLYGSFTKEKVPKDSLDDFGDGDVRAGTTSASKYIVLRTLQPEVIYNNTEDYYTWEISGIADTIEYRDGKYFYYVTYPDKYSANFSYPGVNHPPFISFASYDSIKLTADVEVFRNDAPITYNNTVSLWIADLANEVDYVKRFDVAGTYNFDTTFTFDYPNVPYQVSFGTTRLNAGVTSASFDNINIYGYAKINTDSVRTLARSISLDDLVEDTTYTYYTSVLQPNGRYSKGADSTFNTPVFAPINLTIESDINKNVLRWDNTSSIKDSFQIIRKTGANGTYAYIGSTVNITYVDSPATAGDTLYYQVRTVSLKGNYSSFCNPAYGIPDAGTISFFLSPSPLDFGIVDSSDVVQYDSTISSIDTSWVHTDTTWVCVDSSASVSGGTETGGVFINDFEEGNSTDYDAVAGAYENPSIISGAARHGSYGFGTVYNGGASYTSYGTNNFSDADNQIWSRFYVKLSSNWNTTGTFKSVWLFELRTASNYVFRFGVNSDGSGNPYRWYWTFNDAAVTSAGSTTNFSSNAWHLIEIHWKGNDASTGGAQVWVDSTSILSEFTRNTNSLTLTSLNTGTVNSTSGVTMVNTAYTYIDDIRLDATARVPAYTVGSGDTTWTCIDSTISAIDSTISAIDTAWVTDTTYADSVQTVSIINQNNYSQTITISSYDALNSPFSYPDGYAFLPTTVPANDTVTFRVRMSYNTPVGNYSTNVNIVNSQSDLVLPISATIFSSGGGGGAGDTIPPNAPSSFTASGTTTSHILNWSASTSSDVYKYLIYRGTLGAVGGSLSLYDSVTAQTTSKTYSGLSEGDVYEYQIFAEDSVWNISTGSNKDSALVNVSGGTLTPSANYWYVGVTASGNGSGTDWANKSAYTSMTNILNNAEPGDTIWVDGGTYSSSWSIPNFVGTLANPIYILKSNETGHNSAANFTSTGSTNISISSARYVYIKGLTLSGANRNIQTSVGTNCIWLDGFDITCSEDAGLYVNGSDSIFFFNSSIIGTDGAGGYDTDLIAVYANGSNLPGYTKFYNNYFENNNTQTSTHSDIIQWNKANSSDVYNNIAVHNTDYGLVQRGNAQLFYSTEGFGVWRFWNNILVAKSTTNWNGMLSWRRLPTGNLQSFSAWNNTIIGNGTQKGFYLTEIEAGDSINIYNNVVKILNTGANGGYPIQLDAVGIQNIDYNILYNVGQSNIVYYGGSGRNWTYWTGTLGFDANGYNQNPNLTNDLSNWLPQAGSICIDNGTVISIFDTDIDGTLRPQGSAWDIGAYEQ